MESCLTEYSGELEGKGLEPLLLTERNIHPVLIVFCDNLYEHNILERKKERKNLFCVRNRNRKLWRFSALTSKRLIGYIQ